MAQLKDLLVNGSARVIGSLFANLSGNVLNFGVCSTAAATAAKTVTTNGTFELITGSKILVLFSETDSSNAPTLNVNGTGAKSIKVNASDGIPKGFLVAQQYYWFVYDGTNWRTAGGNGNVNINAGTANRMAYYSEANIISAAARINYLNNIEKTYNSQKVYQNGLRIWGTTYGNTANQLISNTGGVFRYGDGGPQIQFSTGETEDQDGALIFTDHDTAGTGVSFHFVSNQNSDNNGGDLTVTAPRFRARKGLTIGQNSDNTSYNLYVKGTSYFTETITGDIMSAWHLLAGRPSNTTNFRTYFETVANLHHDDPARTDCEVSYNRWFANNSDQTNYSPAQLNLPVVDQHVLSFGIDNNTAWSRHIALDIRSNKMFLGGRVNNTWQNWSEVIVNDLEQTISGVKTFTSQPILKGGFNWPTPANITCTIGDSGNEWSIDLFPGSTTGTYWHVWSAKSGASILQCFTDNRHVIIPVHLAVGGYNNTSYGLSCNSFICNSWIRTTGSTGWYNETHGGGWYMNDNTWIRTQNNKSVYSGSGTIRSDNDVWGNRVRLADNQIGFYQSTAGGNRYGYIQADSSKMYFRKENGNNGFDFNGHLIPSVTNTYDLGSSSLNWKKLFLSDIIYNYPGASITGGGKFQYCTIITINTNAQYINNPIVLEVSGRGIPFTLLQIHFQNSDYVDPKLLHFTTNCSNRFYIKKTNTNQWTVYCQYTETWGSLYVHRITGNGASRATISLANVKSLPADCIQVSSDFVINGNLIKKLTIQANGIQKGQFNNSADVTVNLGNVAQDFTGANSGNANNINADTFAGMTRQQWLNTVYPVGSIYMSVSATSPAILFGGKWEQLKDCFLLSAGDTYKSGDKGGEANHILSVDEMPAHSHDRGTMNITGNIWSVLSWQNNGNVTSKAGAFSWTTLANGEYINPDGWSNNNTGTRRPAELTFNAADTWTGNTSSVGSGKAHNNMPPYLTVYMWKRTA